MPIRNEYLQIVEKAYTLEQSKGQEQAEKGLKQIQAATPLFGFFPTRWMLDFGATCAFLFTRRAEPRLAEQAKQALLYYRDWLKFLPPGADKLRPEYEDGIPPMDMVFSPVVFAPAVQAIRPALTPGELDELVGILADTLRPLWRFPEWGGHNRAMLRGAGLAVAAAAFPEHADAGNWTSLADELAEESWGRWSIEDAMLYQPHWLRALFLYAEARGRQARLREMIQPRLHLKAMTQMVSPLGILPDFGDSHWISDSHWEWMACLEWGAAAYGDPGMKWAANRIHEGRQVEPPNAHTGTVAALAWKWCDDTIPEHPPLNQDDALDDLVLKKLVWRTGWGPDATYACLNYRDEGDYGRVARDYLRTTLAVTAEKMHHGHADEGGFSMLVHKGALLLHESGYRESPPDGIYRSAVYHNRLAWQDGQRPAGQGLLEFLRGDGRYQPLRTERLYQTRVAGVDFRRIRTTDEKEGLVWDRSVVFLPVDLQSNREEPCWIVMDSVLSTSSRFRTVSQLWWTQDILAQGPAWYETHLRGVMDWPNRKDAALLICTPVTPGQSASLSVEPFRRHFQDEVALTQTWSGEHIAGRYINFVTVLWPHPYADLDENRARSVEVLTSQPAGRGLGVRLNWHGVEYQFCTLNDLAVGNGQEDVRPTYTAEQGLTGYGQAASDAAFVAVQKGPQGGKAGFINGTYLSLDGRVLYQGKPHAMFQEDRTARTGVPARFRWEGEI